MADAWTPINGVYTATAPLFPWVASFPSFDAGVWGSALISAGIGAGVGAWMAGRIARNAKLRDELLAEFRSIDVAITLCISVSDVAGGMKSNTCRVSCKSTNQTVGGMKRTRPALSQKPHSRCGLTR